MKDQLFAAVSVIALVVAGFALFKPVPQAPVGAVSGPDFLSRAFFYDDAIVGGSVFATSSQGAATYTAAQVFGNKFILHTAAAALTATLPASSTISQIPRPGDTKVLFIQPVTNGITLAGGTGTDLNTASSTKFCVVGQLCELTFVRKSNTDIEVILVPSSGN